ncbi:MAG TPA: helix-turn-helix domain-containing protein [Anaerolineales bacterium]|nr:helix-turn-helix domain-containing protein [Anaerolineales bacterium]
MMSSSLPLPEMLEPLFWDLDFSALSWQADRDLIVRRILQKGGWPAVRWLRSFWGDQDVRRWLEEHAGGRLSPRQLRYWELVLNLPEQEVEVWIARAKDSLWEKRVQTAPGALHGRLVGVRVSFLEFRCPLLSPLVHWEETGASLASLDDLACMKLSAIAQRGSKKEYYDSWIPSKLTPFIGHPVIILCDPLSSLYKLARMGKIPCQKVGRHWRFRREAIERWLEQTPEKPRVPEV